MNCPCGGGLELGPGGMQARCTRCGTMLQNQGGQFVPVQQGYGAPPQQGYGAPPQQGYGAPPQQGYGAPQGAPVPFGAPQPGGQAPPPQQPQGGGGLLGGIVPQGLQINIHGIAPVPINLSSDGVGFDQKKLENKLVDKAKTEIYWFIGTGVVILLVVIGLAGLGFYIWSEAKSGASGPSAPKAGGDVTAWDGKAPFECSSGAHKIVGTTANLPGKTAVVVKSNCQLTLENVNITADVGIDASANGKVTVQGGSIDGKTNTAVASGNAQIVITGAKVTGKSKKSGNGMVSTN